MNNCGLFFISFYHNTKKARWFEIVEEIKSGYQKTLEKWHWTEDLKKFGRDRNEARDMILTSRRERKWSWFSIPLYEIHRAQLIYSNRVFLKLFCNFCHTLILLLISFCFFSHQNFHLYHQIDADVTILFIVVYKT